MSIFDAQMPITSDPMAAANQSLMQQQAIEAARQQGLMGGQTAPQMTAPQQVAQSGYLSPQQITEMYGIMAGGATNPDQLMQQYVRSMQQQQALDYQDSPVGKFLKLYGTVNPRDWTADSMRKFHQHFVNTGQIDHGLLTRAEQLSESENEQIIEAENLIRDSRVGMVTLNDMIQGFEQEAIQGIQSGVGVRGTIKQLMEKHITGGQDAVSALRQKWRAYKMEDVLNALPPGVASDRDVALAMDTWPPDNANPAYLAAWLRGMQKIQVAEMAMARHRAGYIGDKKRVDGLADDWDKNNDYYLDQAMKEAGLSFIYDETKDNASYANNRWRALHNLDPGRPFDQQAVPPGGDTQQVTPGVGAQAEDIKSDLRQNLEFIQSLNPNQ